MHGGWDSSCTNQEIDPANTVLDGNQTSTTLVLSAGNSTANLAALGLTIQNGRRDSGPGGGVYASTDGQFTISHSIIRNNSSSEEGGGIYPESVS